MSNDLSDERYFVRVSRSFSTGIIREESWETPDGKLHRIDGPAVTSRDPETGNITALHYFQNGLHHRDGGEAAYMEFDAATGGCIYRAYFEGGQYSRSNGLPHIEWINPLNGNVFREEYKITKPEWGAPKLHREDGPARLNYDRETGTLLSQEFFTFGRRRDIEQLDAPSGPT